MLTSRGQRRLGVVVAVAVALIPAPPPAAVPPGGEVVRDAFTATAGEVRTLREDGAVPVCGLRVAVWEPDRPDAGRLPPHLHGDPAGAGGERWLDPRAWPDLAPVLSDRLRLCWEKGFTAVSVGPRRAHPAGTGLTPADWARFDQRVRDLAARHGLVVTGR